MTYRLFILYPTETQSAAAAAAPIPYLALVAFALAGWYGLTLWVWTRYRAADQAWSAILFGGWVLLNRHAFRAEGLRWLSVVRATFLVIVLPLVVALFWRWPA
jgi:hypothetical protein